MKPVNKRVSFDNGRGNKLVGLMEWPEQTPTAFALFSHCFTCTKDLKANVRISRNLAKYGFCTLRYDFTGLSDSSGDFSETNFTTNCQDIIAAAQFLSDEFEAPKLLIGHSMGGTATAVTANEVSSAQAVVTIASPGSTQRLAGYLDRANPRIAIDGQGEVAIGGVTYRLKRQLLDDLNSQDIEERMAELRLPILMFHSPDDQTLPYEWGLKMFEATTSPKSFVTLDGSDHLLMDRPDDVDFVASIIHCWSKRYIS